MHMGCYNLHRTTGAMNLIASVVKQSCAVYHARSSGNTTSEERDIEDSLTHVIHN